jgi:hypothetical protein
MMTFVHRVINLPPRFFMAEMVGIVVTVYLEMMMLVAVFLSTATKIRSIQKVQRRMFEISKTDVGIPKKNEHSTTQKNSEEAISFRNRRSNEYEIH